MASLEETKDTLISDISEILNDTKAYQKIIRVVREDYKIDLDKYDHIFTYIEECIADMILSVEEEN